MKILVLAAIALGLATTPLLAQSALLGPNSAARQAPSKQGKAKAPKHIKKVHRGEVMTKPCD